MAFGRACLVVALAGCHFHADQIVDANPGGDADDAMISANIVFITSGTVVIGKLGGLTQADGFCTEHATAAGLPGTYRAWLSTQTVDARDRLVGARGWVRVDSKPVADKLEDLVGGRMFYPPRLDEHGGDDRDGALVVATATDGAGNLLVGDNCSDYTTTMGTIGTGRGDGTTVRWTDINAGVGCTTPVHLYCFGVDLAVPVTVPAATGKRAFISRNRITMTGVAGADAVCASEAAMAGLAGMFRAALATTMRSASSRVGAGPWFRLDNVAIGSLDAPLAPINVVADGSIISPIPVWTGATSPSALGTTASTCSDWTSTNASGLDGDPERSSGQFFDSGAVPCTSGGVVYCLEQ